MVGSLGVLVSLAITSAASAQAMRMHEHNDKPDCCMVLGEGVAQHWFYFVVFG